MDKNMGCCSLCMNKQDSLFCLQDGYICRKCFDTIPWECKTVRVSKGIGMANKYAEKFILPKMNLNQIRNVQTFAEENEFLKQEFSETLFLPESGMVVDGHRKLFYFDIARATLTPALKEALLQTDTPRIVFRAEWVCAYWLDFAYYKIPEFDGALKYHPLYAQIVLQFEHPVLRNKSVRLEVNRPVRAELMMKRFYNEVAEETLRCIENLTGFARLEEGKTYYDS